MEVDCRLEMLEVPEAVVHLLDLRQTTSTIPIVFVAVTDPVGSGLVASLARPGGNIMGLTNLSEAREQPQ